MVIGLLLAFAVSLGVFTATYNQQAKVDAQLTLGADVTVDLPAGRRRLEQSARQGRLGPGCQRRPRRSTIPTPTWARTSRTPSGSTPLNFRNATSLRDSYFLGGSADQMMSRLASTPDGILVSLETINDYSLHPGDLLRLRVLDQSTGRFRVAPFHVIGTVQEFPSAPRDSFMVANLGYLDQLTHSGPNVVFAKTSGSPPAVASRVAAATAPLGTEVKNIDQQTAQTVTSITTVDLTGISHLEEAFAIVLVGGGDGDLRAQRRGRAPPRVRHDDRDRRARCGRLAPSSGARSGWSWSRARCSPPGSAGCSPRCWSRC